MVGADRPLIFPFPRRPHVLDHLGELDPARPTVVHRAGGYRSSTAASVLRSAGFPMVADVLGGFAARAKAGLPVAVPARTG